MCWSARRTSLPESLHLISVEVSIDADQRNRLGHRLRDQQSVERIAMMEGHLSQRSGVSRQDGQDRKGITRQLSLNKHIIGLRQRVLADADLDRDLPVARRADQDIIVAIGDQCASLIRELRVIEDEPQKGVRIQQQPHGM